MARAKKPTISIDTNDIGFVVTLGERRLTCPAHEEADTGTIVVNLDHAAHFDPPHEAEDISIETLQAITAALEDFADAEELDLEFE